MAGKYSRVKLDLNKLNRIAPVKRKKKSVKKYTVKKPKIYTSVYKCKICGKRFGSLSAKERHTQGHYVAAEKIGLSPVTRTNSLGREEFVRFKNKSSRYDII